MLVTRADGSKKGEQVMFTGTDSLLAHQQRGELAREIASGRLERGPRTGRRPSHGRRWTFWLSREVEAPATMPPSPKLAHLCDAGFFTRT